MESVSSRDEKLGDRRRRWVVWASQAITDTPPDFFAGEPLADAANFVAGEGSVVVAPTDLWWLDGKLVTEREWSVAEHADDPPEWATWPPARRAGQSDAPS